MPRFATPTRASTHPFDTILKTAVKEVGAAKLVESLRRGDPMWAFQALRRLPEMDVHRTPLLAKTAENPHSAAHALRFIDNAGLHEPGLLAAQALVQSTDVIDKFEFDNQGVYVASFAMKWINNGTVYQVTRQNGDLDEGNPWPVGGGGLFQGDYDKVDCTASPTPHIIRSRQATKSGCRFKQRLVIPQSPRCVSRISRMRSGEGIFCPGVVA